MPAARGGYYRRNKGFIEWWEFVRDYENALPPDGKIPIGGEAMAESKAIALAVHEIGKIRE